MTTVISVSEVIGFAYPIAKKWFQDRLDTRKNNVGTRFMTNREENCIVNLKITTQADDNQTITVDYIITPKSQIPQKKDYSIMHGNVDSELRVLAASNGMRNTQLEEMIKEYEGHSKNSGNPTEKYSRLEAEELLVSVIKSFSS